MNFSQDEVKRLEEYCSIILKWNKSINLISKTTEKDIWNRHILDSAQLINYIDKESSICDIGSGAGLPGIVLSIIGVKNTSLVESDIRKCVFLNLASKISNNKVNIINDRIENLENMGAYDYITSRALADIPKLLSFSEIIQPKIGLCILKGQNFREELKYASLIYSFDSNVYPSVTNPDSCVIEIRNIRRKNENNRCS